MEVTNETSVFIDRNDDVAVDELSNELVLTIERNIKIYIPLAKVEELVESIEEKVYEKTYNQLEEETNKLQEKIEELESQLEEYQEREVIAK